MLVKNKAHNCMCHHCREHINSGDWKYKYKSVNIHYECKPNHALLRWAFNQVKEMSSEL